MMTRTHIKRLVRMAYTAAFTTGGRLRSNPGPSIKDALATDGTVGPCGDGDVKTGAPGTYRPVGPSCPDSCPALNKYCYAQGGNVNIHQTRSAQQDTDAHLRAAIAAMVWARATGRVARLHVSGDMGKVPDLYYMERLAHIAAEVQQLTQPDGTHPLPNIVAWTYTAHNIGTLPMEQRNAYHKLAAYGIVVRQSNQTKPGGAIVADFSTIPALRLTTGQRILKCPAQLRKVDCASCTLCWTQPSHTVAFHPHGTWRNRVPSQLEQ